VVADNAARGPAECTPPAVDLLEIISDTVILLDRDWRYVYINRAAEELAGKPRTDLIGRELWATYPQLIGTPIEAAYRRAMGERAPVSLDAIGVLSGRWYDIHIYPAEAGLLVYGRDVTARKHAERAMQESEERFRAQYESMPVPTYTWRRQPGTDDAGRAHFALIGFNDAANVFTRGEATKLIGISAADLYRDAPDVLGLFHQAFDRRTVCRRDMSYRLRSTGEMKDMLVTFAFAPPDLVMVHTEDVTERRRAERALSELNATLERRVAQQTAALVARAQEIEAAESHYRELAEHNRRLARELEHRVGNHLAGLIALVREMTLRGADAEHLARAMEDRLVALAHVHRLLTVERWASVQLQTLAESLFQALRPAAPFPCPSEVQGPGVAVDSSQATALAMILTEWFTNSCKYGVHSAAGGRVDVRWQLVRGEGREGNEGELVRLTWTERGGPPIEKPPVSSLGTELVRGFATRELRGRYEMTFPREGATHWLEFPVSDLSARETTVN
jgi:PAS domain S-box-containing protein